jgi:hypothetical protein
LEKVFRAEPEVLTVTTTLSPLYNGHLATPSQATQANEFSSSLAEGGSCKAKAQATAAITTTLTPITLTLPLTATLMKKMNSHSKRDENPQK